MTTLPREKWRLTESADWWSARQVLRQQTLGAATEMMLEVASVQPGSRVLDVAAATGEQTLMAARHMCPLKLLPLYDHALRHRRDLLCTHWAGVSSRGADLRWMVDGATWDPFRHT
jgi:cyclopropane fatty-acyl-phospholipid synthase-like methyltransferase